MPIIDEKKRIIIPQELRERSNFFNESQIAIYYEKPHLVISKCSDEVILGKLLISIRSADNKKGRFFLSRDMLELLNLKVGDTVFVGLCEKDKTIHLFSKS